MKRKRPAPTNNRGPTGELPSEAYDVADSTTRDECRGSVFFVAVKTLIEDDELMRLRAMAEGTKRFEVSGLWEKLEALDLPEVKKLPPRERLGLGYYVAAKRKAAALKEG